MRLRQWQALPSPSVPSIKSVPVQGLLWEYACSEINNDAIQIMVGARNAEKAASEKPKTPAGIPISQACRLGAIEAPLVAQPLLAVRFGRANLH